MTPYICTSSLTHISLNFLTKPKAKNSRLTTSLHSVEEYNKKEMVTILPFVLQIIRAEKVTKTQFFTPSHARYLQSILISFLYTYILESVYYIEILDVPLCDSHAPAWLYIFGFALSVPCLLYVVCFVLFPLCTVFPCLYQCKIYCHRVKTKLQ
jgi:hypothetical protein